MRMLQEPCEIMRFSQTNRRMVKSLHAQPVIIAHHAVPRIAHKAETDHRADLIPAQNAVNVGQRRMLPQPSAGLQPFQAAAPFDRLWRIADQNIVAMGPRLQRQRHRGATRFGNMDKDVTAPA